MLGKRVVNNILGTQPFKDKRSKNKSDDDWYTAEDAMEDYMRDGYITCPSCGAALEIDATKCGNCGWRNRFQI